MSIILPQQQSYGWSFIPSRRTNAYNYFSPVTKLISTIPTSSHRFDLNHIIYPQPQSWCQSVSPVTELMLIIFCLQPHSWYCPIFTPIAVLMSYTFLPPADNVGHVPISNLRVDVIMLFLIPIVSSPEKSSIIPNHKSHLASQFENLLHSIFPSGELCHFLPILAKTC